MKLGRRVVVVSLLASCLALADSESDAADVMRRLATALAGDNAAAFLKSIDPSMPGYAKLRTQIEALIGRAQVSSSISILENQGDDSRRTLSVDWYIEIRSRGLGDQTEPRRRTVQCTLTKAGKTWRVVELNPAGLFD